ncbi:P-loop containing nucleoside triphosphate hydrolase protein [Daldinia grandis]|nr:P-loop containing nucleoside triphosphate hydrolase protein [Daldinia grandis]
MRCEIKHLDQRWDEKQEQYFAERKLEVEEHEQKDWWRLFAFCVVKQYSENDELDTTRLYVNPQPLRQLLKDVIGDYPDDPIDVNDVQIETPYYSLFHYRKQLEWEGLDRFKNDEDSKAQLELLINWIKSYFGSEISAYEKCVSGLRAISYESLWTLFPPNEVVHVKILDQHRAFRVHGCWYEEGKNPHLKICANFIDFDGNVLGMRRAELPIKKYAGTRQLTELTTIPLDLHDDNFRIRAELIERGRKFECYVGQCFEQYDGVGVKKATKGYTKFDVKGRIMIDCATYHRLEADEAFNLGELEKHIESLCSSRRTSVKESNFVCRANTFAKLSDDDALITCATVRGYTFELKQFLEFFIDNISPIKWDADCFDNLVLDPATKKTVQAVVSTHSSRRDAFDDIVKGKGQGLVCVLHGPPGVGKTLTAECVAEYVKRPLYMISSGDLGAESGNLDRNLSRIMDLASTWKAVLLIDESDVFLEQRSPQDVHRNAMVSVFLRALEYYSGILFLTTNRVKTFDEGFKSRIHIPIRYTDLSLASRLQIWRNLCSRVSGGVDVDEAGFQGLAEHDLNGRQIKNVIKAAESLAAFDSVNIDYTQLKQMAKIQDTFEKDLTNIYDVDYTAPGESNKKGDGYNMFM